MNKDIEIFILKYNGRWTGDIGKEKWIYDYQKFIKFSNAYKMYNIVKGPKEICIKYKSGLTTSLNDMYYEEYLTKESGADPLEIQ